MYDIATFVLLLVLYAFCYVFCTVFIAKLWYAYVTILLHFVVRWAQLAISILVICQASYSIA